MGVVVVNTDLNSEDVRLQPSTLVEYILEATTTPNIVTAETSRTCVLTQSKL